MSEELSYHQSRKDYLKAYGKRYREEHKDYFKAYAKRYREEHKEELKAYREAYKETHKEELKAYREEHKDELKIKDARIKSYKRGLGYSPLNSAFLGSHIHHLHEESNTSFCVYIPCFLHDGIYHNSYTGEGMQSINAVALSYWLIDYQFFKDD